MELVAMAAVPDDVLRRFYFDLMAPAFHPAELMLHDELVGALSGDETHGVLALDGDEPVAGIVTEDYLVGEVMLVAYLVVSSRLRGQGIGARLLREVAGKDDRLVLAEIEDPRFHPVDERTGDPVARARFYARNGSRLLPLDYTQPSLREGSPRVANLLLITIASARADTGFVDGELVARFLDEYYAACEGEDVLTGDPAYRALRAAALGDKGRLVLTSLDDLAAARPSPH